MVTFMWASGFLFETRIRPAEKIFIQESLRWKYAWLYHININNMSKQADNEKNVLQILNIENFYSEGESNQASEYE